jgi:hypothetical protein
MQQGDEAVWEVRSTTTLPSAVATFHQYFSRELTLPKLLKQNGVKMLAGSDTAVIANWVILGGRLAQGVAGRLNLVRD